MFECFVFLICFLSAMLWEWIIYKPDKDAGRIAVRLDENDNIIYLDQLDENGNIIKKN